MRVKGRQRGKVPSFKGYVKEHNRVFSTGCICEEFASGKVLPYTLLLRLHGRVICHMNGNFVGFQNMCDFKR